VYQLEIEKLDIPTVTIVTSDFLGLAESAMRGHGAGDMALVVVPHPLGNLSVEEARAKADAAFTDTLYAATEWEPTAELEVSKPPYPAERFEFTGTVEEANKLFFDKGWSLGLPIIPPTTERVEAILKGTDRKPDEVLWEVPPRKGVLTIELLATHAVMAGCKPEYMPLLIAIVEAMKDPDFAWASQTVTTNPTFPLIIVSGPIVDDLCIGYEQGAAGGGNHANVSIGYCVNLIGDIVGGSKAPAPDKSTLGQPANVVAMVIGENTEAEPSWTSLNIEMGYSPETSTVTLVAGEDISNMNIAQPDTAEEILKVIAIEMETIGPNNSVLSRGEGTDVALLICPQHANAIAKDGWSKDDVRQYLFENARIPYKEWVLNLRTIHFTQPWYQQWGPGDMVPAVDSPDDIIVVVAGGAGAHSQYLSGFGGSAVTKPIDW